MTSKEASLAGGATITGDDRQVCYRHPDRDTYVRCGRCDRPICSRCAVQGPVGIRCLQCGEPARDPVTSFTMVQAVTGGGVALAAGVVSGVAGGLGLLGLCVALFAGGFAGATIRRQLGYKRGPNLTTLVFGGLLVGALAGYVLVDLGLGLPLGQAGQNDGQAMVTFVAQTIGWALLVGVVACFGAQSRLR